MDLKALILLVLCCLFSCSSESLTNKEIDGIQRVIDFYGGDCNIHKGNQKDEFGAGISFFEIEITESELLESLAKLPQMPASNIAYLFYSSLGNEVNNYNQVHVKIILEDSRIYGYQFPVEQLRKVQEFVPVLAQVSNAIKNQEYKAILELFEQEDGLNMTEMDLKRYCTPFDSAFGEVNQTQFQGFTFYQEGQKEGIHVAGLMSREKENTPISLFFDLVTKKLTLMKYEF